MFDQMTSDQLDGLAEMLGFGEASIGMCSIVRTIPALPGTPTLRDMVEAYLDAVRERVGL